MVLLVSEMFMYVISAIAKDDTIGTAIAAAMFGAYMVCCGFVIAKSVSTIVPFFSHPGVHSGTCDSTETLPEK